jgi:hypothetical protein
MIPEDGNYYPWQVELWAWAKEREEKTGTSFEIVGLNRPLPKLSDILKCLDAVCAQPEIWGRHTKLEEFTDDEILELGGFVCSYVRWYLQKNNLEKLESMAFDSIQRVVWRLAERDFKREDIGAIKDELGPWFWVDDLPQYPSRKGINQ